MNFIHTFVQRRIAHRPNLVKIVDNIGWLFFDKLLRMGVGLFVGVWITRYLGPEQFGLLSFATAFIGLFGAIAALGLQFIVVRDIIRNPDCARETLGTAALMQLIGGLLSYLLILVAIAYLRPDDAIVRTIVAILGSMMLLRTSDISVFWFESQVQSKYTVWVQNSVFLVFAAIKVMLILQQAPLIAFVWATLVEAVVAAIILLGAMSQRGPSLAKLRVSAKRAKSLLKDCWPLIFSSIAVSISMKIDQIMLGEMIDDKAVGIYSAATRISEVWYFVIPIVLASIFPALANLNAKKSDLLLRRWSQVYALMFWLSVAVALLLSLLAGSIVNLLFGEAYSGSAIVLIIHAWAGINVAVGSVWSNWILLENKLQIGLYGQLAGATINVGLNLWLIPVYGAAGAALATLGSYWLSAIFAYSLYKPAETFSLIGRAVLLRRIAWN